MTLKLLDTNAHCPHCEQRVYHYASSDGKSVFADVSQDAAVVSRGLDYKLTTVHLVHACAEEDDCC